MFIRLLRLYARLPLPVLHWLGYLLGWVRYLSSARTAERTRVNLEASGLGADKSKFRRLLHANIAETGKALLETLAIWFRPYDDVLSWVRECKGWEYVERALSKNKGVIFLTPHLGCFEITSLYYSSRYPMTVLYRPPRKNWINPLILAGRQRGQITLAPANLKGVRQLFRALKRGEAVGILPDQVPAMGEGEWADFFGRPAYTMTLVNRLVESTGATVLLAFGERLAYGRGYVVHIEPLESAVTTQTINQAIEKLVRRCPEQYLWSYMRHKVPPGVAQPAVTSRS